jgi:hypothetical protein
LHALLLARVVNTAKVKGADFEQARDKETVGVEGEPPNVPGPCRTARLALRC